LAEHLSKERHLPKYARLEPKQLPKYWHEWQAEVSCTY